MSTIKDQTDLTATYVGATDTWQGNIKVGVFNDNEVLPSNQDGRLDANIFNQTRFVTAQVANKTGVLLAANSLVGRTGFDVTLGAPSVTLADNTTPVPADGFLSAQIADNTAGQMITLGTMTGLNTGGGALGDFVYSGTGGAITLSRPTANDQIIGIITKVDAVDGHVWFDPTISYRAGQLQNFKPLHSYAQYDAIQQAGAMYRAKVAFTSGASFVQSDWEEISSAPTSPESFGAVGDGVADDTTAVQSAINTGHCRLVNNYRCISQLSVSNPRTVIEGPGTLTVDEDWSNTPFINLAPGSENSILKEFGINETNASPTNSSKSGASNAGIQVQDERCSIENVLINGFGYGILARNGTADHLTIRDCEVKNCYSWGIEIDSCRNVNAYNNETHTCGLDGFKLQNENARTADGLNVDGLWTYNNGQRDIAAGGTESTNGNGIDLLDGGFRFTLRRVYAYDNYGSGLVIKGTAPQPLMGRSSISDSFFNNNKSTDAGVVHGIEIGINAATSGSFLNMTNIHTDGNTGDGLKIHGGSGYHIQGINSVQNTNHGIDLDDCFDVTIDGFNLLANGVYGIEYGASNNQTYTPRRVRIKNGLINGNYDPDLAVGLAQTDALTEALTDRGIQLYNDSSDFVIEDVTIANCSQYGILYFAGDVTIDRVRVPDCPIVGIWSHTDATKSRVENCKIDAVMVSFAYTSGSGTEPVPTAAGTQGTGNTSTATGQIIKVETGSGSWAGGDAAGTIYMKATAGMFQAGETVNLPSATTCTLDSLNKPYGFRGGYGTPDVRDNEFRIETWRDDYSPIYFDTTLTDFRHSGNECGSNFERLIEVKTGANIMGEDIIVNDFGCPCNGVDDDHPFVQHAIDLAAGSLVGKIVFRPGHYRTSQDWICPNTGPQARSHNLHFIGEGATIETLNNDITIFNRRIDTVTGVSSVTLKPHFIGFDFIGQATNGARAGTAIAWHSCHGGSYRDLNFFKLTRALDLVWNMDTLAHTCHAQETLYPYRLYNGDGSDLQISSVDTGLDELTVTQHGLADNQRVRLVTAGTLPGGTAADTNYYVEVVDNNTITLWDADRNDSSSTQVNITSAGTGNNYVNARRVPGTGSFGSLSGEGGPSNSNNNAFSFRNCRAQLSDANSIGFDALGAGRLTVESTVCEGSAMDIAARIRSNSESGGVIDRDVTFENFWVEMSGGGTLNKVFEFNLDEAHVKVTNSHLPTRQGTTPNETVYADFTVSDDCIFEFFGNKFTKWVSGGDPWFKHTPQAVGDKNAFVFRQNRTDSDVNYARLDDPALWDTVPLLIVHDNHVNMGKNFEN